MCHRLGLLILGVVVFCPVGCGPKLCEVTGKVTYNKEAFNEEGFKIVFLAPQGQQVAAPIAPNGEYKAIGVVAGENKVAIFHTTPAPADVGPRRRGPGARAGNSSPLQGFLMKYADVNTSGLKTNVDTGTVYSPDLEGEPLPK
jgi:hypothetical protein